jgi:hypothetical protein
MTTKLIVCEKSDGVVLRAPSPKTFQAMVGAGGLVRPDRMDDEIANFVAAGATPSVANSYIQGITYGGLSEADALELLFNIRPPEGTIRHFICERDSLLSDREFRDAWECLETTVQVNMPKARVLHMDAIRASRNAELVKEDVTFMRAVEEGDTDAQATIKTKKQTLRDLPATFDITTDAGTPELLKVKWPTELPARE